MIHREIIVIRIDWCFAIEVKNEKQFQFERNGCKAKILCANELMHFQWRIRFAVQNARFFEMSHGK